MKYVPAIGATAAVVVAVLLFSGGLSAQSAGLTTLSDQNLAENAARLVPQDNDQDLDSCQQDCRSRFGYSLYVTPQWRRGGGSGAYYAYAHCIAQCNRKFWKSFDREMDRLDKE